ncbi:hypothetical protein [Intrasporangium oryzae]|uniref:hypothetical protein n=1 Tax=Intrasporangium oryzae TaxID=412687 RepID=UPI0012FC8945|nr:hypothetical protein [Intrasporangium oryzae]
MHTKQCCGTGAASSRTPQGGDDHVACNCAVDIHIDSRGDVNIYNCAPPDPVRQAECQACAPPAAATCIPVTAGAKHKLSREQKLGSLAVGIAVPSSIAAGVIHMMRRFLLDLGPANPLEASAFVTFAKISRDTLTCALGSFDATPPALRGRLVDQSLLGDPSEPLNEAALTKALGREIVQRIGVQVFGDPMGLDQERPGRIRVYEPPPEDYFNQVRICRINDLRTGFFIPPPDDYTPAEIEHDCAVEVLDGQPQVVCQVRTTDCPGNSLPGPVTACERVLNVAYGDGVILEGVNYFSTDAKVRFSDRLTGAAVRDVDAHVWGDIDTPVTEDNSNGQHQLVNDCRVHDRLAFSVPNDLAPGSYQFQVVVPNITGIGVFGVELLSNAQFLNVLPAPTTRFEIVTESILARKETSPAWWGSDEVGLHTTAYAFDTSLQLVDFPDPADPSKRTPAQDQSFKDIQNVDFDSGTRRDITRKVFAPDKPILGMLLVVLGDEIDSQHAYDAQITSIWENFLDLVKDQLPYISAAVGGAGLDLLKKFSAMKAILEGIGLLLLAGIDLLIAWWAPADPIIRDKIALSINDLATLTSSNTPAPDPTSSTSAEGIIVRVNQTVPPVKLPNEYHEVREYDCPDQDSLYEITYRFTQVT